MDAESLGIDYQQLRYRAAPTWAHLTGEYSFAGRFEDVSGDGEAAVGEASRGIAAQARALVVPPDGSSESLDAAALAWDAENRAAVLDLRFAELDVDHLFGPLTELTTTVPKLPLPDEEVAAAMPAKLRAVARNLDDRIARLRDGRAAGRTPVLFAVEGLLAASRARLGSDVDADPLLNLGPTPAAVDRAGLLARVRDVVADEVRPAVAAYAESLRLEAAPTARDDEHCGLCWLPDGTGLYAALLRSHTTTDLGPDEIHRIGLEQVELLEQEYAELGAEVFGCAHVPTVMRRLRDDPDLHYRDPDELLRDARRTLERASLHAPRWFGRVPRAGCAVESATSGSLGSYVRPARDGSRGATFVVNVADPSAWARFEVEALSFHEGVPGHHQQIALAAELTHLPEFRRTTSVTGYSEGWGLYAERLADEVGLYSSPLDRFGMLSFDSLRACRLVVDTGIHALGWSRARAKQYLAENSPLSSSHVDAEVDRYVVVPGQATAYMLGRLEIMRIREEARARLGARFDLARFHDVVLGEGQLPLPLLDAHVRAALR
ncbi:MAG: DUF885 domain-containing protein [Nocardioidaceae bacterium]|nr:DUF885 domain-containing protein [Nocardioidaceae bacterium]